MLTGKALDAFKSWYEVKYGKHYSWSIFIDLPLSFQFGVYQDWADSMGIDVKVEPSKDYRMFWFEIYNNGDRVSQYLIFKTRQKARTAALQKLNEIINKR